MVFEKSKIVLFLDVILPAESSSISRFVGPASSLHVPFARS